MVGKELTVLPEGALHVCGPHQVWPLRSECCGRGAPMKVVCAECMKMCCLGGKDSVVKGLNMQLSLKFCCECSGRFLGPNLGWKAVPLLYPLECERLS